MSIIVHVEKSEIHHDALDSKRVHALGYTVSFCLPKLLHRRLLVSNHPVFWNVDTLPKFQSSLNPARHGSWQIVSTTLLRVRVNTPSASLVVQAGELLVCILQTPVPEETLDPGRDAHLQHERAVDQLEEGHVGQVW